MNAQTTQRTEGFGRDEQWAEIEGKQKDDKQENNTKHPVTMVDLSKDTNKQSNNTDSKEGKEHTRQEKEQVA